MRVGPSLVAAHHQRLARMGGSWAWCRPPSAKWSQAASRSSFAQEAAVEATELSVPPMSRDVVSYRRGGRAFSPLTASRPAPAADTCPAIRRLLSPSEMESSHGRMRLNKSDIRRRPWRHSRGRHHTLPAELGGSSASMANAVRARATVAMASSMFAFSRMARADEPSSSVLFAAARTTSSRLFSRPSPSSTILARCFLASSRPDVHVRQRISDVGQEGKRQTHLLDRLLTQASFAHVRHHPRP